MAKQKIDLLQETLDLLVLKTLQSGPAHGWDIAQRIQQVSRDVLKVNHGSLYPALRRLEELGHSSLGVTAGYAHGTPTVIQGPLTNLLNQEARLSNLRSGPAKKMSSS